MCEFYNYQGVKVEWTQEKTDDFRKNGNRIKVAWERGMKKNLLIFIILVFFIACETDKQFIIKNTDIPLISRVLIGDEIYMEYSYNDANLLIEEKSKFHYSKHFYNNNNQLVASDIYWDMRIASSNSRVLEEAMNRKEWVNPDNTPKSISHVLEYGFINRSH